MAKQLTQKQRSVLLRFYRDAGRSLERTAKVYPGDIQAVAALADKGYVQRQGDMLAVLTPAGRERASMLELNEQRIRLAVRETTRLAVAIDIHGRRGKVGMFDNVTCKLPGVPDLGYQCKDLLCTMDDYEISSDGRLLRTYASSYLSDEELSDGKGYWREDRPLAQVDFTGVASIYTEAADGGWLELDIEIEAGNVRSVTVSGESNTDLLGPPGQVVWTRERDAA